ncbi:hypothetical protein BDZ45DRAFT_697825 [Acephala macrosclerotiorum]|nr:hypothetical protein BDZ45DRAFT_697825 [Acephala macrosclerotiorum]
MSSSAKTLSTTVSDELPNANTQASQVPVRNYREALEAINRKPSQNAALCSLPDEVKLMIFDHLPKNSSACLGLACKAFYPLHREKHGTVKLDNRPKKSEPRLCELIHYFFSGLFYEEDLKKFVTLERRYELSRAKLQRAVASRQRRIANRS